MEIVEVRFIKDSQSVQTGNEFYLSGATAHFYMSRAKTLVEQGQAVFIQTPAGSDGLPEPLAPTQKLEIVIRKLPELDFSTKTVKQLRGFAKLADIPITSRMKKADLVAALEGNYG